MGHKDADLWICPECGQRFATRNLWHSCGEFTLEALFAGCQPHVWPTYQAFERMAREVADFHVIPQKSRVSFQLRTRCAGGSPMKSYFRASFVLRQVTITPRIDKIQSYAPDQHVHHVRLSSPEEVDEDIRALLAAATEYGEQRGRHR